MEHTKHVFRAGLLLVAVIVTYVLGRGLLVPDSFGMYGHYRYRDVLEQRERAPVHGAPDSCKDCHGEVFDKRTAGKHATVPCEDCHAPLATHVAGGKHAAAMRIERSFALCVRCHRTMISRPAVVRQVVPEEHVEKRGERLAGKVCMECHDPHAPELDGDEKGAQGGRP